MIVLGLSGAIGVEVPGVPWLCDSFGRRLGVCFFGPHGCVIPWVAWLCDVMGRVAPHVANPPIGSAGGWGLACDSVKQ